MSVREPFASRPWIAWPAAVLAISVVVNLGLLLHRGGLYRKYEAQRDRALEMKGIAEKHRRIKAEMTARSDAAAPAGLLDFKRVEELAAEHRVADGVHITIPPAKVEGAFAERFVDVTLAQARPGDVARFLLAVESLHPAVKTRSLRIVENRGSSRNKEESFVDADIRISAYEKASTRTE